MANPNIRFKKAQSYPTSGVNAGDVIFCTDDHTIYVATGVSTKEGFYGGAVKNVTTVEDDSGGITGLLITYMDGTAPLSVDFFAAKTALEALQTQVNTNKTDIATLKTKVSTGATSSAMGMMSAADKAKLDGIEAGANKYTLPTATDTVLGGVKVDSAMSATSTNPVQNKIAKAYADTKVSSVTSSSNAIVALEHAITHAVGVGLRIDVTTPGNVTLSQGANGLKAAVTIPSAPEYTVEALATAETGYLKTYRLKKDGSYVGASINIPKDFLVKSGTVVVGNWDAAGTTFAENASGTGKALKLVIATKDSSSDSSVIYINVKDLVDVYTAGDGISVSADNKISISSDAKNIIEVVDPANLTGDDTTLNEAINSLAGMSGVSSVGNGKVWLKGDVTILSPDERTARDKHYLRVIGIDDTCVASDNPTMFAIKLDPSVAVYAITDKNAANYLGGTVKLETETTDFGAVKFGVDANNKLISGAVQGLGTAAGYDSGAFATAAQGAKADNSVQYSNANAGDVEIQGKLTAGGLEVTDDCIISTALQFPTTSSPIIITSNYNNNYDDGSQYSILFSPSLRLHGIAEPVEYTDAANKLYVDNQIFAVSEKLMWTTF